MKAPVRGLALPKPDSCHASLTPGVKGSQTPGVFPAQPTSGFTLIEMVVTMTVIGILTTMLAVGYPAVRDRQTLQRAQQQLELLVREAQQQTLNEERAQTCRDQFPGDAPASVTRRRRCSDVGIHIQGATVTLFADLDGNKAYAASPDYEIRDSQPLPAPVTQNQTIVFNASPPYLTMYGNGALVDDQHPLELTIQLRGGTTRLVIGAFGTVEQR